VQDFGAAKVGSSGGGDLNVVVKPSYTVTALSSLGTSQL
jgi:hypothetical protein